MNIQKCVILLKGFSHLNNQIVVEKEFFKFINKQNNERLRIRITIEKGKVSDIVVQYETLLTGK
jgi:hypothetical protein